MPRERTEFFRESGTKPKEKLVVLAFEGNNTERQYFEDFRALKDFNKELIHLFLLTRAPEDTKSAPQHVFNQLKQEVQEEYELENQDELWMIIDTDRWKNIPEIVQACDKEDNMYVAISNPCFELWLLLHIALIDDFEEEEWSQILENKKTSRKKRYIDQLLTKILGGYNKSKLQTEQFLPHINQAVSQAKKLDKKEESYPKEIGSHIYKLVEKLLS